MIGNRKFRLRTTLVVPFVLQIAAAVGLVGYLSFRNGEKTVDDLVNQLNGEVSARIEQHVVNYLNHSQNTLWLTYQGVQSGNLDPKNQEGLQRYFWRVVHQGDFEQYLSYGNEQGEFVGVEHQEDGTVQLKIRTLDSAPIREIYGLDQKGDRQKLLKTADYDPRTRPWYKAAKRSSQPTWSEIYPFSSSKNTVLGISPVYPMQDTDGNLLGVLCINVRLTQITEFISHLAVSPHGQSFIIERSGNVVASSTIPQPFKVLGEGREIERMQADRSDEPMIQTTAQQLLKQFGSFNAIRESQRLKFESNGAWYYAQVQPIQDGRGIDWLTVVVVPESDFMAQIQANTKNTVMLCLGALGLAIGVGILTSRWVTRPLLNISHKADNLAQGDLNQQVPTSPIAEVNTLASSFNMMAEHLQQSFDNLRIAEENYRSIFENALEGIFQSSPDGRFINVNPALANIYGYDSPQEMIDSITDIGEQLYVDPEQRITFRDRLQKEGSIKEFEYRSYCKDSNIIWTQIDAHMVRDSSGTLLYYEGMVQDISDRKRRENELRRQLAELKIEIDQKKRQKEVARLTESSYFQEVQEEISKVDLDEFWS